jgi:hypothetical protein
MCIQSRNVALRYNREAITTSTWRGSVSVMGYYKFLSSMGTTAHTGTQWLEGRWVESAWVRPCFSGVHACRVEDLGWWLGYDLWEVELDGDIQTSRHKVAAPRGRLVRCIDNYREAVHEMSALGVWRSRDWAVDALRGNGRSTLADDLSAIATIADLHRAREVLPDTDGAGLAVGYAIDAAERLELGELPESPFVTACAAGHRMAGTSELQADFDLGYNTERQHQSHWLAEKLSLR